MLTSGTCMAPWSKVEHEEEDDFITILGLRFRNLQNGMVERMEWMIFFIRKRTRTEQSGMMEMKRRYRARYTLKSCFFPRRKSTPNTLL